MVPRPPVRTGVATGGPKVINLSLAAPTRSDQSLMGLSALEDAALENQGQSAVAPIVVAAAGNSRRIPQVVPRCRRLDYQCRGGPADGPKKDAPKTCAFSNFGDWVDVWAPRVDVVSSFEAKPFQTSSGQLNSTARRSGMGPLFRRRTSAARWQRSCKRTPG